MKSSACASGTSRDGWASSTEKGPIRVRRSSRQYASPRSEMSVRTYVPAEHSIANAARSPSRQSCSKRVTLTGRSASTTSSPARARS